MGVPTLFVVKAKISWCANLRYNETSLIKQCKELCYARFNYLEAGIKSKAIRNSTQLNFFSAN